MKRVKIEIIPPKKKISGSVHMPGSKSYTNRALIMASLAGGRSEISGISEGDDSVALINALRKLGVKIDAQGSRVVIQGSGGKFREFKGAINVGHAGTTMRFLTSLCSLIPGEIVLDGSERMRDRPIGELVEALRSLGAQIEYLGKESCPPLKISGGKIHGGKVLMDGTVSSQFFTSLLLTAPILENGLEINVEGDQISKSYIDMTIDGLESFGVGVENDNYKKYSVDRAGAYKATYYKVEGDASGASYFWAIAAVNQGKIRVENVDPGSAQGDIKFPDLLERMGCKVVKNPEERWIEVEGSEELEGIDANMELMPDTAQTLAIVAAFAKGKTEITGLSNLRIKETDRLAALRNELEKMKIHSEIGDDYIVIEGGKPASATIETYKDHRMAMSFAVAGTRVSDVKILEPDVVSKSFPAFWRKLNSLSVKTI